VLYWIREVAFLRFRIGSGLIALNLLVITLMLVIILVPFSESLDALRIILALPIISFSPGYGLVAFLLPREGGIDPLERLAISFGLSIAILAIIGLILNYSPTGITIESVVYSTAGFTMVLSALAIWRRWRTSHIDRFNMYRS
jgi:uncharacterized membrane protein